MPKVPLLNSIGESHSISSAPGANGSEDLLSIPSPPHSRPSSSHGSAYTDATQFEDVEEDPAHMAKKKDSDSVSISGKSIAAKEAKGNVIVSVRVRPDTGGADAANVTGEWMVDGRRSLISLKGGEGGEYRYGKSSCQSLVIRYANVSGRQRFLPSRSERTSLRCCGQTPG